MGEITLVCFDLDGVLVPAPDWHATSFIEAVKEITGYELPLADHKKDYNGLPTITKLNMLVENGLIKSNQIEDIERLKQVKTVRLIEKHSIIDPNKLYMHQWLLKKNIRTACVTNCSENTARLMLELTGQWKYIELLVHNKTTKNPKPAPDPYIYAMKYFEIKPDHTLCVEDSARGAKSARASGAYLWKVNDAEDVHWPNLAKHLNDSN